MDFGVAKTGQTMVKNGIFPGAMVELTNYGLFQGTNDRGRFLA